MISLILYLLALLGAFPGVGFEDKRGPRDGPRITRQFHSPPGVTKCDRWELYNPGQECPL